MKPAGYSILQRFIRTSGIVMRIFLALVIVCLLAACGQKGPLFLPKQELPERELPEQELPKPKLPQQQAPGLELPWVKTD